VTALSLLIVVVWAYLLLLHGSFWKSAPELAAANPAAQPAVAVIVPARDESATIHAALSSLLGQQYGGALQVVLIDDGSTDGTGTIAHELIAARPNRDATVIAASPRPAGWSGKLWAIEQGIDAALTSEFYLLTDADIEHDPRHLAALIAKAVRDELDLVSEMVWLNCASGAERWLVPAFVYFFQLLYPFEWVNNPLRRTAAAAGGTILIRRRALDRIGGMEAIRGALIDDVALAAAVKTGGPIWLGHSALARSLRRYPQTVDIWRMIARTAFVQLHYSWLALGTCLLGMALTFLAPPLLALLCHGTSRALGLLAWLGMAGSLLPTLRRYRLTPSRALALPAVAAFYMAATLGSALDHARGRGVQWKGRAYRGAAG
jgi:hopene-associated glycosyltransferase HpnB